MTLRVPSAVHRHRRWANSLRSHTAHLFSGAGCTARSCHQARGAQMGSADQLARLVLSFRRAPTRPARCEERPSLEPAGRGRTKADVPLGIFITESGLQKGRSGPDNERRMVCPTPLCEMKTRIRRKRYRRVQDHAETRSAFLGPLDKIFLPYE